MIMHCGCCGGDMESQTQIWCNRCKAHVLHTLEFWEATWYAQTGKYCPFTVCQFVPFTKAELKKRGLLPVHAGRTRLITKASKGEDNG